MTCADGNHTGLYWYPAANEEGWLCVDCEVKPGEPPGYSPQHDRSCLREKVWSLVHELADAKLISVSNSSHGEGLADAVTRRLHGSNRLDQYTIIDAERIEHADYWSKISTAPPRRGPAPSLRLRRPGVRVVEQRRQRLGPHLRQGRVRTPPGHAAR